MRFALVLSLSVFANGVFANDTVNQAAAQLSGDDCLIFGEISDKIAEYRQDGKSERRTTRLLTKGKSAVDERLQPAIPTLVAYFYSLPKDTVVPGAASEAFTASCTPKTESK